jgi:hypothetical protein
VPWRLVARFEALSPSNPGVSIRSSRVAACRRHAAEKPGGSATFSELVKRHDLEKAIATADPAAVAPVPTLSRDTQPLSFVQYTAPGASTLASSERFYPNCRARVLKELTERGTGRCSPPALSGHQQQHLARPSSCSGATTVELCLSVTSYASLIVPIVILRPCLRSCRCLQV